MKLGEIRGFVDQYTTSNRSFVNHTFMDDVPQDDSKMRKTDRVIKLRPIDGKTVKDTAGNTDPGLWTGSNNLHAIKEDDTNLWYLKYENGGIPAPLKVKWTSFKELMKAVEPYYLKRGLKVHEIID